MKFNRFVLDDHPIRLAQASPDTPESHLVFNRAV